MNPLKSSKQFLIRRSRCLSEAQEKEFDALHEEETKLLSQAKKLETKEKIDLENEDFEEVETQVTKKDFSKEQTDQAEAIAMRSYLSTGIVDRSLHRFMAPAKAEKNDNDMIAESLKSLGIELAATQTTTTTGGGYTIPRGFQAELEKAVLAYGGMWEAARILRTSKGNTIDWPTVNDTNNKAYLLSQSTSAATDAAPIVFGTKTLNAYKYTSGLIQVPTELVEDSEFDIASEITMMLAERIYRGTNEAFTTADGSSKPQGLVATGGADWSGFTADVSSDSILNLIHSVDPGYRKSPKTQLMVNDTTLKAIKILSRSTTDKQPLWLPSMRDGEPSTINGYRYSINQDMQSNSTAGAKWAVFGDFSKYIIRLVKDMRIVRLNERYGELDQVAFVVFIRVDGEYLNAGTNPLKYIRVTGT